SGPFWEGGGGPCLLPGGHALLSVDGIAHTHEMLTRIHRALDDGVVDDDAAENAEFIWWHPLWVPFAERNTGDSLFDDRRPGWGAIGEYWHDDANTPDLWPSLAAMIADITDAVEMSRNIRYYRPRVEAGVLGWEIAP
ncbi:SMI1/KNR4 family protein, partial [Actinomadura adrarensis]